MEQQLSDEYLDQVDQDLMKENAYKNIGREMFYDNPNRVYVPQINDEVYFIFQGYEDAVG